jgi:hypothetical protein
MYPPGGNPCLQQRQASHDHKERHADGGGVTGLQINESRLENHVQQHFRSVVRATLRQDGNGVEHIECSNGGQYGDE